MLRRLKKYRVALLSPLTLLVAACGGGKSIVVPRDPDQDDGQTTVVVLDRFDSGNHGENVSNTVENHTDRDVTVVDMNRDSWNTSETPRQLTEAYTEYDAEVINTSFGVPDTASNSLTYSDYTQVTKSLYGQGVTVVNSAGNDGSYGINKLGSDSPYTIDVGALESRGTDIANYSNYHPSAVDFYASGTIPQGNGTSYSAPKVAGMVADLIQHDPGYTMPEIRTLLELNSEYVLQDFDGFKFTSQILTEISIYDHEINTQVIVEAGFEVFENINPDQDTLDYWVDMIDSEQATYDDLEQYFEETDYSGWNLGVAPVELAAAQYHWYEHREATVDEIYNYIDTNYIDFI